MLSVLLYFNKMKEFSKNLIGILVNLRHLRRNLRHLRRGRKHILVPGPFPATRLPVSGVDSHG